KRRAEALKALQAQSDSLQEAIDAGNDKLAADKAERYEQAVELTRLQAMLAQVRAQETKSKVHFNHAKRSQFKKETASIGKDLEVRKTELELGGEQFDALPAADVKEQPFTDLSKEIDDLRGAPQK